MEKRLPNHYLTPTLWFSKTWSLRPLFGWREIFQHKKWRGREEDQHPKENRKQKIEKPTPASIHGYSN